MIDALMYITFILPLSVVLWAVAAFIGYSVYCLLRYGEIPL